MRRSFLALVIVLVAAGCGGADTSETTAAAAPETTAATPTSPPETMPATTAAPDTSGSVGVGGYDMPTTEAAGDVVTVEVADTELGPILVDSEGMTLYVFLPDAGGESTCYDDCAANWPPLVAEATAGEGIDESLLGTVERDDGSTQTTYGGWPLYYFAADTAPGDLNGQGVGENWFVIDPSGEVVEG